jgi:protein TonB
MKFIYTALIFLFSHTLLSAQATAEVDPKSIIAQGNVRIPAYFPRGTKAMITYVNNKLQYPPKAKAEKRGGTVYIGFTVEPDGSLTNIKASEPPTDLDLEVIRVVQAMPKWIPAKTDGKNMVSFFLMAITFTPDK